ncbi:phosphodiester glycosidase family protein [Thermogemmatispora sp.]|uniref:phosphodiester glycosidase family protein n=1 Tax=Thermogemmatispora sp. TaxID=1968838 RepID=UPI001D8D88FD|nr:phosphodiester glycosidase family protein [Thermogemmatispora sp.]MBX5452135.1 phosphodiester glycosidase family protein [Thermogemmatispora sp.]
MSAWLVTACQLPLTISITGVGTPSPTTLAATDGSSRPLDRWLTLTTGVELRYEHWKGPSGNEDTIMIARFEPQHVALRVLYSPSAPHFISDWLKLERGALAVVNGGYFNDQGEATGLVVSDGQVYGASYSGFGGMLYVDSQGTIHLRSLSQYPYSPGEQLQQATQSSPMLVLPGGKRTQFDADASSNRRTVVAFDKEGRLLFIISPEAAFSLDEFDDLLLASDLNIDVALNLDGGSSTGMYLNAGGQRVGVDSLTPVPIALVLQPR